MNTSTSDKKKVHAGYSPLQLSALLIFTVLSVLVATNSVALAFYTGFTTAQLLTSAALWGTILLLLWHKLLQHPHHTFGAANTVTLTRAGLVSILAGLIPIANHSSVFDQAGFLWALTLGVVLTLILDGVDGYLARKTGQSSAYGARFDMEIDALLALVIAILLWRSGEAGIWVLGLGVMRYAFVLASIWLAPLRAPLYPSQRRKIVCVVQLVALCAMLSPVIQGSATQIAGGLALLCLAASFARDIRWLYKQHP